MGKDILAATKNNLAHVLDCQADSGSASICAQAIGKKGRKNVSLLYAKLPSDVSSVFTLAYTALGETFDLFRKSFSAHFWSLAGELLEEDKIKTRAVDVRDGGL